MPEQTGATIGESTWGVTVSRANGVRWCVVVLPLVLVAGCASTLGGSPAATPVPVLSTEQTVRQSLLDLAEAGVLHYKGALVNPNDKTIALDVSVTATGEAGGSISANGQQGALVMVGGTLYVDAPAQFWSELAGDPGSQAEAVDSRWVRVPSVALGVDLGTVLRPADFGASLARHVGAGGGPFANRPTKTANGAKAVDIAVGAGTVTVAAAGPHGVLHVTMPSDFGTARNVSLDVADVSTSEPGIYQNIDQQAQQLQTVVDTDVNIEQGNQTWGTCAAKACSVVVTFTNAGTVPTKVIVQGNWKGDGQPTGTCQAIVGPVPPGRATTAMCTNNTQQWTAFFNHAHITPGQHPYEVDWTAEALATPPNLTNLSTETSAAAKPATVDTKQAAGPMSVYVINYQDSTGRPRIWKYGVTENRPWQGYAADELAACRSASKTSCSAQLVTTATNRPSADALATTLVTAETSKTGSCPPGQWVDCTATPTR
ncbi:MAG TPA: hypothetical protein VH352_12845 [Pseudonocardiaceae bacterium]|nr:hypothetical protein [Pseudonocardiaceae bacterium]